MYEFTKCQREGQGRSSASVMDGGGGDEVNLGRSLEAGEIAPGTGETR